jgi:hypothetical protein
VVFYYAESMKSLPRAERRAITKTSQRGQRVDDPERAAMAIQYATEFSRRCRWGAVVYSILGAFSLLFGIVGVRWFQIALALGWLVLAAYSFYIAARTKRSIPLNQALIAGFVS